MPRYLIEYEGSNLDGFGWCGLCKNFALCNNELIRCEKALLEEFGQGVEFRGDTITVSTGANSEERNGVGDVSHVLQRRAINRRVLIAEQQATVLMGDLNDRTTGN